MSTPSTSSPSVSASRLSALFWAEVALSLLLLLNGAVGLALTPRPLFTWFPSLMAVAGAVACCSALLSLDKGVTFRHRRPMLVYVLSRVGVSLLVLGAVILLICGFFTRETTPGVTIPLLILCLLHIVFGVFVSMAALRFRRQLPAEKKGKKQRIGDDPMVQEVFRPYQTSTLQSQPSKAAESSTLRSDGGATQRVASMEFVYDNRTFRAMSPTTTAGAVRFHPDGDRQIYSGNFGGSVQTVCTLASDV